MKTLVWFAMAVLLGACGGAGSGGRADAGQPGTRALRVAPPPIFGLLGERQRLDLSSDQVLQLDSLAAWLADVNREPERELRRLVGGPGPGQGRRTRLSPDENSQVQALVRQIGLNNRQAMEAVQSVLTDEQESIACQMQRERTERHGGPRLPDAYGRSPGGIAPDTLFTGVSGWSWCRGGATPSG